MSIEQSSSFEEFKRALAIWMSVQRDPDASYVARESAWNEYWPKRVAWLATTAPTYFGRIPIAPASEMVN